MGVRADFQFVGLLHALAEVVDARPLPELVALALAWIPLLVLVHELGHAAGVLRLTRSPVAIEMGDAPRRLRFAYGRCEVEIAPLTAFRARCAWDSDRLKRRRDEAWIALAGPTASLLVAVVLTGVGILVADIPLLHVVLIAGGAVAGIHGLITLVADGQGALRILRGAPGRERSYTV